MRYCLVVFILVALSACKDQKPKETHTQLSRPEYENFNEFFNAFKTDSSFQVSRVKFPLHSWGYNEDPESPIGLGDSLIIWHTETPENYKFFNFEDNTGKEYDNYTVESFAEENTATVVLSGVDNGFSIEFHFTRVNGLWYMVKIVDQST